MLKAGQWEAEAPLALLLATLLGMLEAKDTGESVYKKYIYISFEGDLQKKFFKIFFQTISKKEHKKDLRKFSERFLAFCSIILTVQRLVLFF